MKELMSNEAYHAYDAIGSTTLKKIADKSVLHALESEFKQTDAMALGSAFHCLILEPEAFDAQFVVAPGVDRRTKAGKEQWAQFVAQSEGKTVMTEEQFETVEGMTKSLKSHKLAMKMLNGGESEYSYFGTDQDTNLKLKCRPDYVNNSVLIDLKTTIDASPDGFLRELLKYNYHLQAAFYIDVFNLAQGPNELPTESFYFIAVENKAPYAVGVYSIDEVGLGAGRALYKNCLAEYKVYQDALQKDPNYKKAYCEDALELEIPIWALQKAENRIRLGAL